MSKRHIPKYKIDRRLGVNLWGRPKSPFNKRESAPGQHGARRPKMTDFGAQMAAKQKLKGYYGNIGERRFRRYYSDAAKRPGDTGANFLAILERRLDCIVYRAKFVPTVFAARQFVNHGHILVNGRRVDIPSYSVSLNDCVELRESSRNLASVIESMALPERDVPDYIQLQDRGFKAVLSRIPEPNDIPYPVRIETNLIIEYYSM